MKIAIVTPARAGSQQGNRVTALRWARLLRQLGHRIMVRSDYGGDSADVLIALHARRSFAAIQRWRSARAERPVVLALTGTDVYGDIQDDPAAQQSLELAWRLVVLQPLALNELSDRLKPKARVIYQSSEARRARSAQRSDAFQVCLLAHLRAVKDPLRAARAARLLPSSSMIRIVHLGAALSADMEEQSRQEMKDNPRYQWLGDVSRRKALGILAASRLLVQTSLLEGGANVISEAIAASVPVVASAIPGSIGLLGADYPGYFPVGDERALAALLSRAEADGKFYSTLKEQCVQLRSLVDPARERASWKALLDELQTESNQAAQERT
jgi:putative glycosyltransferase (TIGR04348 family)